jgi:hypothetical protein
MVKIGLSRIRDSQNLKFSLSSNNINAYSSPVNGFDLPREHVST